MPLASTTSSYLRESREPLELFLVLLAPDVVPVLLERLLVVVAVFVSGLGALGVLRDFDAHLLVDLPRELFFVLADLELGLALDGRLGFFWSGLPTLQRFGHFALHLLLGLVFRSLLGLSLFSLFFLES